MDKKPSEELGRGLRSLGRRDASHGTMVTGHGVLNYHIPKLTRSDTLGCRACGKQEKTSFHVLTLCLAYARLRQLLLDSTFPELLRKLPVKDLILFWRKTGR